MADTFCSQNQDEYTQVDCGIDQAGVVAVAFVDEDVASPSKTNIEDASYWTGLLNASPPNAYIATKTRGEYPGGTPTEEEGFGKSSTQTTGATHEATIEFEGLEENRDFVEGLNRRKWKCALVTNGGKLLFIDYPCTVYGKAMVGKGINAIAFWQLTIKWQGFSNPLIGDAPASVFAE